MKLWSSFFFALSLCSWALADFRIWEDVKGTRYKAEFIQELFGKISLRDENGKEFRLAMEELSELDQKYLRVKVAPEIEINFSKKSSMQPRPKEANNVDQSVVMIVTGEVTLKKVSTRPYTSRLYAELYLIGKDIQDGNYLLLSKTESNFLFKELGGDVHTFVSEPVKPRLFNEIGGARRGENYEGYLIVVRDFEDKIVAVKTDMKEWITTPDVINSIRETYSRGAGSLRSRYFDKTGKKAPVPHVLYYVPRQK
jgi:hypothetical protein